MIILDWREKAAYLGVRRLRLASGLGDLISLWHHPELLCLKLCLTLKEEMNAKKIREQRVGDRCEQKGRTVLERNKLDSRSWKDKPLN